MSSVTNLILSFSVSEDEDSRIKDVNSFRYRNLQMNLVSVDYDKDIDKRTTWYGGTKFLEANLYIGAFNHLDIQDFINHLKLINWEEPDTVQLIVKEQWDDVFRIVTIAP